MERKERTEMKKGNKTKERRRGLGIDRVRSKDDKESLARCRQLLFLVSISWLLHDFRLSFLPLPF